MSEARVRRMVRELRSDPITQFLEPLFWSPRVHAVAASTPTDTLIGVEDEMDASPAAE